MDVAEEVGCEPFDFAQESLVVAGGKASAAAAAISTTAHRSTKTLQPSRFPTNEELKSRHSRVVNPVRASWPQVDHPFWSVLDSN